MRVIDRSATCGTEPCSVAVVTGGAAPPPSGRRDVGSLGVPPAGCSSPRGECRRRAVVAVAGQARTSDRAARALARSLVEFGIDATYIGREEDARRIAAIVADDGHHAVELYLARGGVRLLRELLRELIAVGRRDVSIVVHRLD